MRMSCARADSVGTRDAFEEALDKPLSSVGNGVGEPSGDNLVFSVIPHYNYGHFELPF